MKEKQDNNKLPVKIILDNITGTMPDGNEDSDDKITNDNNVINTMKSNRVYVSNPSVLPISGFRYYQNFLTDDDVTKIMNILDSNPWRNAVRRRQQFYGEIYYHTIHDVAEIQPTFDNSNDNANTNNNNNVKQPIKPSNVDLDMSPFQFLIDKFYI